MRATIKKSCLPIYQTPEASSPSKLQRVGQSSWEETHAQPSPTGLKTHSSEHWIKQWTSPMDPSSPDLVKCIKNVLTRAATRWQNFRRSHHASHAPCTRPTRASACQAHARPAPFTTLAAPDTCPDPDHPDARKSDPTQPACKKWRIKKIKIKKRKEHKRGRISSTPPRIQGSLSSL